MRIAIQLIYQLAIYLLLPLVGWGVKDLPGLLAHPARALFIAVIVAQCIGRALLPPPRPKPQPKAGQEPFPIARAVGLHHLNLFALESILLLAPFSDARGIALIPGGDALRYTGLALFALGSAAFIWTVWAQRVAEKTADPELEEVLVTSGPYRHIRYPRLLGDVLLRLGVALVFRAWVGVFFTLLLVIVMLARIPREEEEGRRRYGLAWNAYVKKSWKLVPFIY